MDASDLELAVQKASKSGHISLMAEIVKEGRIVKDTKIIIISNFAFEVFTKEKDEVKWIRSSPWVEIKKVSLKNTAISLKFENSSYYFSSENSNKLFGAISHVLVQTQTFRELKDIGLLQYQIVDQQQTALGAMSRLLQLIDIREEKIPHKMLQMFKQSLMFNETVMDLRMYARPEKFMRLVCDLLPLCPQFTSFIIPQFKRPEYYTLLVDYVSHFKTLDYIEICGKEMPKLKQLTDAFEKEKEIPCAFAFTDGAFSSVGMKTVSQFIAKKSVTTIGFHQSFTQESLNFFYEEFFTPDVRKTLVSLDLSGTSGVDLNKLMPKLPHLLYLSLENCGYQFDNVLMALNSATMRNLRGLNINGNLCSRLPNKTAQLPPSLCQLVADNVHWGNECMPTLIKMISKKLNVGFHLSVCNAAMSDEDWDLTFLEMDRSIFTGFLTLRWNGNPVDSRLFNFLLRNTEIETLDLSGCFMRGDTDSIDMLCEFIPMHVGLKNLYIAGNESCYIGPDMISSVAHSVRMSKTLKLLDISENHIGDKGLVSLKQFFIGSTTLEVIDFDGSYPETDDEFIELLEEAGKTLNDIKVSYPVNDFARVIQRKNQDHQTYERLVSLFKKRPKFDFNKNDQYPIPPNSPFSDPFYVYKLEKLPPFPKFIRRDVAENMKRAPPPQVINRQQFNKKIKLVCKSKFNKPSSPVSKHFQQYNLSMMEEFSDSSSEDFDSHNIQVKVSIESLKPDFQKITQASPVKMRESSETLVPRKNVKSSFIPTNPKKVEIDENEPSPVIMPPNGYIPRENISMRETNQNQSNDPNETLILNQSNLNSKSANENNNNPPITTITTTQFDTVPSDLIQKQRSPTKTRFSPQKETQPTNDNNANSAIQSKRSTREEKSRNEQYSTKNMVPPEYSSLIPHSSAYPSRHIPSSAVTSMRTTPLTVPVDEDDSEEEDYSDDESGNSNSRFKSARLPFDGNYDYYSESEDDNDFDDYSSDSSDSTEDFTTHPPSDDRIPLTKSGVYSSREDVELAIQREKSGYSSSTQSNHKQPKYRVDSSSSSDDVEPKNQHKVPELIPIANPIDLPPPPRPPEFGLPSVQLGAFDKEALAPPPPQKSTLSTVDEITATNTTTLGTAASRRKRRPQRGITNDTKTNDEPKPVDNSFHESRIFGTRVIAAAGPPPPDFYRNRDDNSNNNTTQQSVRQSSIYGSRRRGQNTTQMNSTMNSTANNTGNTTHSARESSIYGSRRRGQNQTQQSNITANESQQRDIRQSSIYGSRANRNADPKESSIYGSRVNRARQRPVAIIEDKRESPPKAPVVRTVRTRPSTRTRTTDTQSTNGETTYTTYSSRRESQDYETYSSYDSYTGEIQRPPPIDSPKSTTVVSTSIGSPTKSAFSRKY